MEDHQENREISLIEEGEKYRQSIKEIFMEKATFVPVFCKGKLVSSLNWHIIKNSFRSLGTICVCVFFFQLLLDGNSTKYQALYLKDFLNTTYNTVFKLF